MKRAIVATVVVLIGMLAGSAQGQSAPEKLPQVTSGWTDPAQQKQFFVRGERYAIGVGTHPARVISLTVEGREVLAGEVMPGLRVGNRRYVPAGVDVVPKWQVHTGQQMRPATSSAARMNVWRAAPQYWEVRLRDIPFVPDDGREPDAPLRGELVFHAHPDRLHLVLHVEGLESGVDATAEWPAWGAQPVAVDEVAGRSVARFAEVAVLAEPGGRFAREAGGWTSPLDATGTAGWGLRPIDATTALADTFAPELEPVPDADVTATDGRWLGYDPRSGLYRMELTARRGAFSFEHAWKVPGRRMASGVQIRNRASRARSVTILAQTGLGNLPAGVIADPHGFPLPIPAMVCKNFSGEREEPDDSAFGDIVFAPTLPAAGSAEFRVIGAFQRWGTHMVKQVSSIRFFNIYWHLSTGVSETTCFTHAWMKLRGAVVHVPDFRPYSGPFIVGQPQHECFTWPGFLHYQTAAGEVRPMYQRTVFRSIAPNLADFVMHFRTSDGAARMSVRVIEVPQTDEARTFLRVRFDWDRPVEVSGDARQAFRWLNVFDKHLPRQLLWLDRDGNPRVREVASGRPMLLGEPLAAEAPFAGTHEQRDDFSTLVLVRSFKARLGGRTLDRPHLSAEFGGENGSFWFGADRERLRIEPGDFIEADLLLMPHAEVTQPLHKPQRERRYWATAPPRVSAVSRGKKEADFPATIRAENDAAAFVIEGGLDTVPIVVTNFSSRVLPMLWREGQWQDQQHHGGDGWQVDHDAEGRHRFTFVYPIRGTERHDMAVSLMKCDRTIVSVADINGAAVVTAEAEARFATTSPAAWFPGRNTFVAEQKLIDFAGRGQQARMVPVALRVKSGSATLDVVDWSDGRLTATVEGDAATLVVSQLAAGGTYRVEIDGKPATRPADSLGELRLDLAAGRHRVLLALEN